MGDLAVRQPMVPERLTVEQIKFISQTELIPKAYRGNVPAMMACILTGRALGLDDMHSLRAIHVVDGKATLSAELMVTLVRQAGHSLTAEMQPGSVTVKGRRVDNADEMTVTWTMEMAQRAGLANKQNWRNYPEAMLWARAVSQLCRMLFADVLLGLAYTQDEMGGVSVEVPAGTLDEPPPAEEEVVEEAEIVVDDSAIVAGGLSVEEDSGASETVTSPADSGAAHDGEQGDAPEQALFQPPSPEVEQRRAANRRRREVAE